MEVDIRIKDILLCNAKQTVDGQIVLEFKNGKRTAQITREEMVRRLNSLNNEMTWTS